MTDEQRQELIRLLQQGEEIAPEWARILFPPEKREYELVYHGKEREEDTPPNTPGRKGNTLSVGNLALTSSSSKATAFSSSRSREMRRSTTLPLKM
jgi:hypothetical protein